MSENLTNTVETTAIASSRTIEVVTSEILYFKDRMRRNVLNDVINIGRNLIEAKGLIEHGKWGEYLENEVDFSQRTANNYMQLFEKFGAHQMSIFGGAESPILGELTYSKALALLPVPDDEVENFVKENDAENISVRELTTKVAEAYKEKEDAEAKRAEIEKQLDDARKSNQRYAENEQALVEKINQLEEQSGADKTDQAAIEKAVAEEKKKHEKALADKEKSDKKVKDLEEKLRKAKADQEAEITKAKDEAKKSASEEARNAVADEITALKQAVQESQEKANAAEKKASAAANASVMKFKFLADEFQKDFQGMLEVINGVEAEDGQETGKKLKTALSTLMGKMFEKTGTKSKTTIDLPCSIGDTLYSIYFYDVLEEIVECKVSWFTIDKESVKINVNKGYECLEGSVDEIPHWEYTADDIGKVIFFSAEAAVNAMKEEVQNGK